MVQDFRHQQYYWMVGSNSFGSQIVKGLQCNRSGRTPINSICNLILVLLESFQYGIHLISLWYHRIQIQLKSIFSIRSGGIHPFQPLFHPFQPLLVRNNIDILTAMAVGSDSIWVAGEPRLLLRLGGVEGCSCVYVNKSRGNFKEK